MENRFFVVVNGLVQASGLLYLSNKHRAPMSYERAVEVSRAMLAADPHSLDKVYVAELVAVSEKTPPSPPIVTRGIPGRGTV